MRRLAPTHKEGKFQMSNYQATSIHEALKVLTRPEPGSEWDQRIQQMAPPQVAPKPQRTIKGDLDKITSLRQWSNKTLVKAAVGLYLLGVLTPVYVHRYAPEKQAAAAPTVQTALASSAEVAPPKLPAL